MYSYSLNALIVFYEVVTLDSFPWADDLLFMTQSGVSNHVAQLEAQTGTRLLIRKKGKPPMTSNGSVYLLPSQEKPSSDVSLLFLKSRKCDLAIRRFIHHGNDTFLT
jgi:hypothetical protein